MVHGSRVTGHRLRSRRGGCDGWDGVGWDRIGVRMEVRMDEVYSTSGACVQSVRKVLSYALGDEVVHGGYSVLSEVLTTWLLEGRLVDLFGSTEYSAAHLLAYLRTDIPKVLTYISTYRHTYLPTYLLTNISPQRHIKLQPAV
jgi:hypothetical protein